MRRMANGCADWCFGKAARTEAQEYNTVRQNVDVLRGLVLERIQAFN